MPIKSHRHLDITPTGSHNYDKDKSHYYILYYDTDINFAKDTRHFYNIWSRMEKEWGELPKRIKRVDCTEIEYRETFGMQTAPTRITMETVGVCCRNGCEKCEQ